MGNVTIEVAYLLSYNKTIAEVPAVPPRGDSQLNVDLRNTLSINKMY